MTMLGGAQDARAKLVMFLRVWRAVLLCLALACLSDGKNLTVISGSLLSKLPSFTDVKYPLCRAVHGGCGHGTVL